jgi:predicted permease
MANTSNWTERLDALRQDTRFAIRSLAKNPGFTLVAVLTLALGIGANSAIFSVVNGVLLKPLPYPRSEQLVSVWQHTTTPTSSIPGVISAVNLDDWRSRQRTLTDLGGYFFNGTDLTGIGEPQRLQAAFVTPGFWRALGVAPQIGRVPRDDEMVRGSNDRLVVLSNAFWRRQFGGDNSIVGKRITLGGDSYEVVGVMPATFAYPSPRAEVFIPYSTIPDEAIPRLRFVRILSMVGRLKPGVTVQQASADLNSIAHALAQEYPKDNATTKDASATPLQATLVGDVRTSLLVLLGAVGFVLLIAAVNLASLLLARSVGRERELAIRAALGAERGRIIRQLFTESMVLALVGGALGIAVAYFGSHLLMHLAANQLPLAESVALDANVVLFTVGLSILTGVIFGLVPAIRASTPMLQQSLREGARGSTHATGGLRNALVVTEVALAVVLVVGAGLMTRSFIKLMSVDLGFAPDHRVAVNFTISTARHVQMDNMRLVYQQMLDRVRAVPGVIAAGAIRDLPFRGDGEPVPFRLTGTAPDPNGQGPRETLMFTSDGFFSTMGIPLVAGRDLSRADGPRDPFVLVVNQAFAKKYFGGKNPVGQTLTFGDTSRAPIVGLVGDVHQNTVDEAPKPRMYASVLQVFRVKVNLVARTREEPQLMIRRIEDAIRSVDPQQTITAAFTMNEAVGEAVARPRLLTVLLGVFGAMGLILGALGIYGVLAYLVTQRTREIGVRIALGAQTSSVLGMVIGSGLKLAGLGVLIGLIGAFALTRLMQGVLYGVTPNDPLTFVSVAIALLAVAALASWLPARRATKVDPLVALRAE